jgi:hypothetical protein
MATYGTTVLPVSGNVNVANGCILLAIHASSNLPPSLNPLILSDLTRQPRAVGCKSSPPKAHLGSSDVLLSVTAARRV